MKSLFAVLLVLVIGISGGHPVVELSGVPVSEAKAFAASNAPLTPWQQMTMPLIGHYTSEADLLENATVGQLNFSRGNVVPLPQIKNESTGLNLTVINSTSNTGLVYL